MLYDPGLQMLGLAVPTGHAYPAGHTPVQLADVCAVVLPNRPAGQLVHALELTREYWPDAQGLAVALVEPARQEYPAGQGPLWQSQQRDAITTAMGTQQFNAG